MQISQPQTIIRIPFRRWRSVRFAVHVQETRRHRSVAVPRRSGQYPRRVRGSCSESTLRTF